MGGEEGGAWGREMVRCCEPGKIYFGPEGSPPSLSAPSNVTRDQIVILDFNHFCEMNDDMHMTLAKGLVELFGDLLIPRSVRSPPAHR